MSPPGRPKGEYRSAQHGGTPVSGSLSVESVGSGPPLVLLHGWAMHSGIWGAVIPWLARRFRVHAVDRQPRESALAAPFTLDPGPCPPSRRRSPMKARRSVVGWSLGGLVALRWRNGSRSASAGGAHRDISLCRRNWLASWNGRRELTGSATSWALRGSTSSAFDAADASAARPATLVELRHELFARGQPSHAALRAPRKPWPRPTCERILAASAATVSAAATRRVAAASRWLAERAGRALCADPRCRARAVPCRIAISRCRDGPVSDGR